MSSDRNAEEHEVAAILAALRDEVRLTEVALADPAHRGTAWLRSRRQADRLAAVTAERPYLARPGPAGRLRGLVLTPIKAVLRRLMRWYVEPLAFDQRSFNLAVLRLLDELEGRVAELERRTGGPKAAAPPSP